MRGPLLTIAALLVLVACGTEEAPVSPEPFEPVERSPEETLPVEPAPSVEVTGAPVAALHEQALRHEDPAAGASMLEQACDRGFAASCVALADRYESGEGVDPDPEHARALLEGACLDGSTIACDRLGH